MSAAGLALGYGADLALGDPRRGHPVAGFGTVALALERRLYGPSRVRGMLFTGVLVGAAACAGQLLSRLLGRPAALALLTWVALGGRSLRGEAAVVAAHLQRGDLDAARRSLPALAGRDAAELDADAIARAVVESVAENTSDAVVGALLWGAAAGPAGVAAYRAANTLDAMVGHRTPRYERFGWASARLDDALGWPAARAGAGLTALCSTAPLRTWRVLRRDGTAHPSPNAGRMEAAFAGALGLTLGGPLAYGGRIELRPSLGDGRPPAADDVGRACRLSSRVGVAALAASVAAVRVREGRATVRGRRRRTDLPTVGSGR
ncbi:MAG: CobD/CbiB family cobalamin biosynthesis protein [Solirubrobacteraceae bacterium]|nr:CobD/CbiB family cobalamin biosynthesis protein [Solirubrobacteraceae bacterium]